VVLPKFDLDDWCGAVQKYKVTVAIVVPPLLVLIAKSPVVNKYDLSSIKMFMSGAAPLSAELGDQVEKRLPGKVTQGYGLSETSPVATYCPYKQYQKVKGSCGLLLPGVEARIVDAESGEDYGHVQGKDGRPGELWLRGPTVSNLEVVWGSSGGWRLRCESARRS
jgi:acyl-CoA synthetase (AMP-forming)/AMP-acid ligase II